jgi:hypothetical protein
VRSGALPNTFFSVRKPSTVLLGAVEAKIEAVGAEIRQLKADKADKAAIDSKVASRRRNCTRTDW